MTYKQTNLGEQASVPTPDQLPSKL